MFSLCHARIEDCSRCFQFLLVNYLYFFSFLFVIFLVKVLVNCYYLVIVLVVVN